MNIVIIDGRLTRDPELRTSGNGITVTKFTVAVDREKKTGSEEKGVDFINCTAFGKGAEFVEKYFTKGKGIIVQGKLRTDSYTNKEGNTVKTTEIVCDRTYFPVSSPSGSKSAEQEDNYEPHEGFDRIDDDELPF